MNVLFIGLGGVGQRHLRVLKKLFPIAKIYAVRKKNISHEINDQLQLDTNVNIEEKYNITICKTIADAICFNLDFAIVSNPTSLHIDSALVLIENKVPVLIEKPLSNNNNNINKLLKLSKKNNTIFSVAFMMRYHPCFTKLRGYLDNNAIGRIYNVNIDVNSYFPSWHNYEKYTELYAGRNALGGGVVLTEIHEIDLLNVLFGKPKSLLAIGGKRSALDIDVEDNVSVLLEFKKNDYEFASSINMSFVQKTPYRSMRILGQHGSILWDMVKGVITLDNYTDNISKTDSFEDLHRNDMFEDQLSYFIKLINNESLFDQALNDSIGGHKIVMGIKESLSSGAIVNF